MAATTENELQERISCSRSVSPCTAKSKGQKMEYSHKLTEKKRRDRMNISMSEIAQLLPTSSVSKQLEKAEILEKTINYIKKLQDLTGDMKAESGTEKSKPKENHNATAKDGQPPSAPELNSNYYSGFSDCIKEVFRCLTNVEAMDLEQPCFQRLMGHLQGELHFVSEHAEGSGSDDNHKDTQNIKCPSATSNSSNGSMSSLPSSKTSRDSWRRKRTHENNEKSSIQNGTSKEKSATKRPRVDSDKNSSSDGNRSSTSSATVSSSSKKEKRKVSLCTGCTWDRNRGANSNTGSSSGGSEKDKEAHSSSLKQDTSNVFDKADVDGGQCGPDGMGVNSKWPNHGLDIPIHATPISPRVPYIPNPYTVPTYALHPSGTHYIPVVLHTSFPFPEINGRLNSLPNGYFAALNYMHMKMGSLQLPYFPPSFPFTPPVNGFAGLNGVHNPKHEPVQKQYEPKPTNNGHEHSSTNECTTNDLLSEQC